MQSPTAGGHELSRLLPPKVSLPFRTLRKHLERSESKPSSPQVSAMQIFRRVKAHFSLYLVKSSSDLFPIAEKVRGQNRFWSSRDSSGSVNGLPTYHVLVQVIRNEGLKDS